MFNFARCELCEKKTSSNQILVRKYDLSKVLRFAKIKSSDNFSKQSSGLKNSY